MANKVEELEKNNIRAFWDNMPCGTRGIPRREVTMEYFESIAKRRYRLESFIFRYARFDEWTGRKILEVGCGVGIDLLQFAKVRADVTGIDLSSKSVSLAKLGLQIY